MKVYYMARSNLKKKKKILPETRKYWKQQIDQKWFSRYIRLLYNESGYCRCATCGKLVRVTAIQAGHYIPRNFKPRYDLKNVHPQCVYCNIRMKGNQLPYQDYITARYGEKKNKQLRDMQKNKIRYSSYNRATMRKFAIWLQEQCIEMGYTEYWKKEPLLGGRV